MDHLIQNLSFEAVAVPQDDVIQLYTANATPIKVKIKMKKGWKNNTGIQQRIFSSTIPNMRYANSYPKKIRMIQSDQTIMSFNMLMKPESTSKARRKSQNKFFNMFKTGKCLSSQNEEKDEPPYSSDKGECKTKSPSDIIKNQIKTSNTLNIKSSKKKLQRRPPYFLGKCKPGGCLDPPFSEEKYQYRPTPKSKPELNLQGNPDSNLEMVKNNNKNEKVTDYFNTESRIPERLEEAESPSTLMLYKAGSEKNKLNNLCSLSNVTTTPETSSDELSILERKTISNKNPTSRNQQLNKDTTSLSGSGKINTNQDTKTEIIYRDKNKYKRSIPKTEHKSSLLLNKIDEKQYENKVIISSETESSQPDHKKNSLIANEITRPVLASFTSQPDETKAKSNTNVAEITNDVSSRTESDNIVLKNGTGISYSPAKNKTYDNLSELDINKLENVHSSHEALKPILIENITVGKQIDSPSEAVIHDTNYFHINNTGRKQSFHKNVTKLVSYEMNVNQNIEDISNAKEYSHSNNILTLPIQNEDQGEKLTKKVEISKTENKISKSHEEHIETEQMLESQYIIPEKQQFHTNNLPFDSKDNYKVIDIYKSEESHTKYKDTMAKAKPYDTRQNTINFNLKQCNLDDIQPTDDSGKYHTDFISDFSNTNNSEELHEKYGEDNNLNENENAITAIIPTLNNEELKGHETRNDKNPLNNSENKRTTLQAENQLGDLDLNKNEDDNANLNEEQKLEKNLNFNENSAKGVSDILNADRSYVSQDLMDKIQRTDELLMAKEMKPIKHEPGIATQSEYHKEVIESVKSDEISYSKINENSLNNITYSSENVYKGMLATDISNFTNTDFESSPKNSEFHNADPLNKSPNNLSHLSEKIILWEHSKANQANDMQDIVNKDIANLTTSDSRHSSTENITKNNIFKIMGDKDLNPEEFAKDKYISVDNDITIPNFTDSIVSDRSFLNISSHERIRPGSEEMVKKIDDIKNIPQSDKVMEQVTHTERNTQYLEALFPYEQNLTSKESNILLKTLSDQNTLLLITEGINIKTKVMMNENGIESLKISESDSMNDYEKNDFNSSKNFSEVGDNEEYAKTPEVQTYPFKDNNILHKTSSINNYSENQSTINAQKNKSKQNISSKSSNLFLDFRSTNPEPITDHLLTNITSEITSNEKLNVFHNSVGNVQYEKINASKAIIDIADNSESKEHNDQVHYNMKNKSKSLLDNVYSTTIVDLGFQSYVNDDNEIIIRTFNASKVPKRLPYDNVIFIKSTLTLNESKLSFAVNSDTKISIKIKRNQKSANSEDDVFQIPGQSPIEGMQRIDKVRKTTTDLTNIGTLQKCLSAIYVNDLVPVEMLIKNLRLEIDKIVKYRRIAKNKSMVTKRIKFSSYKRCVCFGN